MRSIQIDGPGMRLDDASRIRCEVDLWQPDDLLLLSVLPRRRFASLAKSTMHFCFPRVAAILRDRHGVGRVGRLESDDDTARSVDQAFRNFDVREEENLRSDFQLEELGGR